MRTRIERRQDAANTRYYLRLFAAQLHDVFAHNLWLKVLWYAWLVWVGLVLVSLGMDLLDSP